MVTLNVLNNYCSFFWENASLLLNLIGVILTIIIIIITLITVLGLLMVIDQFQMKVKTVKVILVDKRDKTESYVSSLTPGSTAEKMENILSGKYYYNFQIEGKEYSFPVSKEKYIIIPFMKDIEMKYVKGRFTSKVYFKPF